MPDTGAPHQIWFPDEETPYVLETLFGEQAQSVHNGLDRLARAGGVLRFASAAERNAYITTPTQGDRVYRTDLKRVEEYYDARTSPSTGAGWFPVSGALPLWMAPVSGTQNVGNAADTTAWLSSGSAESTGASDFSFAADVVTVKQGGLYLISARAQWASNATGLRGLWITKNGTNGNAAPAAMVVPAISAAHGTVAAPVRLQANDTIQVRVRQDSGGSLLLQNGELSIVYLRP